MGWTGKFVYFMGKDYSRSGEIVEQMPDEVILVRFEPDGGMPSTLTAIRIETLLQTTENFEEGDGCVIFESKADFEAFNVWLASSHPDNGESDVAIVN